MRLRSRQALPAPPAELDDAALEGTALFATIRARGVEREAPLLAATLAEFAAGKLRVEGGRVLDATDTPLAPADVTKHVEAQLAAAAAG